MATPLGLLVVELYIQYTEYLCIYISQNKYDGSFPSACQYPKI